MRPASTLLLFDRVDDGAHAARVIRIDPAANRTYHYWHVLFAGVTAGRGDAPRRGCPPARRI